MIDLLKYLWSKHGDLSSTPSTLLNARDSIVHG